MWKPKSELTIAYQSQLPRTQTQTGTKWTDWLRLHTARCVMQTYINNVKEVQLKINRYSLWQKSHHFAATRKKKYANGSVETNKLNRSTFFTGEIYSDILNPRGAGVSSRTRSAGGGGADICPPPILSPKLSVRSEKFKRHSKDLVEKV